LTPEQIIFEGIKLAAQGGTALLISWLAVRWALARYKKEKVWERRLSAYSEVLAGLAEMLVTTGALFEHFAQITKMSKEQIVGTGERYRAGRRRLEEAAAAASIVLPLRVSTRIEKLLADIDRGSADSAAEAEDHEYGLIKAAIADLQAYGRDDLDLAD